jgi:hypothetical protein
LSGWIQKETVFSHFGVIAGGKEQLFSAAKPVFMPYGFNVRYVRVRVPWSTARYTARYVIHSERQNTISYQSSGDEKHYCVFIRFTNKYNTTHVEHL